MQGRRVAAVLAWLALASSASPGRAGEIVSRRAEIASAPASLEVRSSAFAANAPIPDRYSAYHENQSPPLEWSGAPERTKGLAIVVEDPDAPGAGPFVHWLVAAVPAATHALPAGLPDSRALPDIGYALQGATSMGRAGWFGPRPPPGGPHHYHFQVFALDAPLALAPGFDREALLAAMKGHVLARGDLVGTYQRTSGAGP